MKRLLSKAHLAACTVAVAMITFFPSGCKPSQKQAEPREKVMIACVENMSSALVQVADAKGFFADEGIDVVLQHHASGKAALDSMLQGKADLATAGAGGSCVRDRAN